MREKCVQILELARKRLSSAKNFEPRMFVADHFAALRAEIDLETETKLMRLEDQPGNVKVLVEAEDGPQEWDYAVYNLARQSMIDELKLQESELLSSLKHPSEFETFSQRLLRVEKKVSEIEAAVERRQANDWSNLKRLTRVYLEIEDLLDAFRSKALNNKTFIFKADFLNPLGALIVFEDLYLNEAEAMFLKSKDSTSEYEIPLGNIFRFIEKARSDGIKIRLDQEKLKNVYKKSTFVVSNFRLFVKANSIQLTNRTVVRIDRAVLEQTFGSTQSEGTLIHFASISNLSLNGGQIARIEPGALEYLKITTNLTFNFNRIERLNRETFVGLDALRNLSVINSGLKIIDQDCFDELKELTVLSLNSNELEHLTPMQFSSLTKLKTLNLFTNKISQIRNDQQNVAKKASISPFYNMNSLEILAINTNEITNLNGWFEGVPSLKTLNLMQNRLTQLDQCVLNPDMMDTKLEQLNLSLNRISQIHSNVFRNLGQLKILLLNNNLLRSVESCFQYLYSLKRLVLKSNRIERICNDSFKQLVNLEFLDLSMNKIPSLEENMFESLTKLETLNLDHNEIRTINARHFKGLRRLRILNLSKNRIGLDLPESQDVFQDLVSILDLNLSSNLIKSVKRSIFGPSLKQLASLSLANNQISEIEENAFIHLKKLDSLYLDFNNLQSVRMQMFQGLDNLNTLYLSGNLLTSIQEYSFINLLNLESLILDSNLIESIQLNAFDCLFQLKQLNLSSNCIERLEDQVFECLNKLSELFLNSNRISSLNSKTFSDLKELDTLMLSENQLESLPDDVFTPIPQLRQLYLSNNKLTSTNVKAFKNLTRLRHVNLMSNQIEVLDDDPSEYEKLSDLTLYYLNYNPIRYIRPDTFSRLISLSSVNIIGNKVEALDEHFFDSFHSFTSIMLNMNNLRRLDISPNSTRDSQINNLNLSDNKIRQIGPGRFEGFQQLNNLDMNKNKFTEIGQDTLKGLSALRTVAFCSNRIKSIHHRAFEGATSIHGLQLSYNSLRRLEPNTLLSLKGLNSLNLAGNLFTKMSDVFKFVDLGPWSSQNPESLDSDLDDMRIFSQLGILDLSQNYIRDLDDIQKILESTNGSNLFANLDSLVLSSNFLRRFRPEIDLVHFSKLFVVSLSYNEIEKLECPWNLDAEESDSKDEISSLTRIKYFNVDHNRIRSIDKGFFALSMTNVLNINLNGNMIEELHESTFKKLKNLSNLNLSDNKIKALNSSEYFVDNRELSSIQFSNNKIESVHEDLLKMQSKIESVCFSFNKLQRIPAGLFSSPTTLKSINLSDNLIESLDDSTFCNLFQLDSLDLSSNKLKALGFLANLHSLRILNLAKNQVEELDKSYFAALGSLYELNLNSNVIKRLGGAVFSQLTNLDNLDLSENSIEEIDLEAFFGLTKLTNLRLQTVNDINIKWMINLTNLKNLEIRSTTPVAFSTQQNGGSFLPLSSTVSLLEQLVLYGFDLSTSFSPNFFQVNSGTRADAFLRMKSLDLSNCKLEDLFEGAFSSLVNLEMLLLAKNKLKTLRNNAFLGLGRLKVLSLAGALESGAFDQLIADDVRPFDPLEKLEDLQLPSNHIQRLNGHIFAKLRKLTRLYLGDNKLTQLGGHGEENPFENLTQLEMLELGNNQLSCLSHNWLRQLRELDYLYLADNQIGSLETDDPDPDLKQSPFFFNVKLKHLDMSGNNLKQIKRENFRNLKRLGFLILSSNEIAKLDETVFDEITSIQNITLCNNELNQLNTKCFEKLQILQILDLSENKIEKIVVDHDPSLADVKAGLFEDLTMLNLGHNNLREFDVSGLNLDQSRSLTTLHLNANEFIDQEKLLRELSKIRTLELLDLGENINIKRIRTSWLMLELNHLKYLHFDGEIENDLASSSEHQDAFFLNLFNSNRDLAIDERYQDRVKNMKTKYPSFDLNHLYLTERALKSL